MFENLPISDWLHQAGEVVLSREFLEVAVLQLALVLGIFALAWGIRLATCPLTARLGEQVEQYSRWTWLTSPLSRLGTLIYAWLLLVIAKRIGHRFGLDLELVGIAASLTAVWVVLSASAALLRDALLARLVAVIAWIIAAVDITGLLGPTETVLDSVALTVGAVRISLLIVIKAVLVIAVLLWAALGLAGLIGARMRHVTGLSPSVQALTGNLLKIALISLALAIGLNTVGIDLTGLAVFSGAVGVGLGFGLQKIVSNFVSGIILLLEQSIKPGDVIEVGHTYGSVTSLGARYASVHGRDGKAYLIPNETLITNQVVNWSYSSSLLRLDLMFAVPTDADLHEVREFAVNAARQVKRVVGTPAPVCHLTEFGDNAIQLTLRFWIEDPANGVKNVKGDVYLALWDAMRAHGVSLPNPQREIRIRELPEAWSQPAHRRKAAE